MYILTIEKPIISKSGSSGVISRTIRVHTCEELEEAKNLAFYWAIQLIAYPKQHPAMIGNIETFFTGLVKELNGETYFEYDSADDYVTFTISKSQSNNLSLKYGDVKIPLTGQKSSKTVWILELSNDYMSEESCFLELVSLIPDKILEEFSKNNLSKFKGLLPYLSEKQQKEYQHLFGEFDMF